MVHRNALETGVFFQDGETIRFIGAIVVKEKDEKSTQKIINCANFYIFYNKGESFDSFHKKKRHIVSIRDSK